MEYDRPAANAWVSPEQTDYRMACCDCGLVHAVDFRVVDTEGRPVDGLNVEFRARRDPEQTTDQRAKRETELMNWWLRLGRTLFPGLADVTQR